MPLATSNCHTRTLIAQKADFSSLCLLPNFISSYNGVVNTLLERSFTLNQGGTNLWQHQYIKAANEAHHPLSKWQGSPWRNGVSVLLLRPLSPRLPFCRWPAPDVPFIFNEMTADFSTDHRTRATHVSRQRRRTRRVVGQLHHQRQRRAISVARPDKLPQRVINITQVVTRSEVGARPMREAVRSSERLPPP